MCYEICFTVVNLLVRHISDKTVHCIEFDLIAISDRY
jgi:hypothetical protein